MRPRDWRNGAWRRHCVTASRKGSGSPRRYARYGVRPNRAARQALWRHDSVVDAAISPPGQKRLEVLFGYGTLLAKETGLAKPVLAVVLRERGRDYRLGYEVRMQNGLALSASGTARETANPWPDCRLRYQRTCNAAVVTAQVKPKFPIAVGPGFSPGPPHR